MQFIQRRRFPAIVFAVCLTIAITGLLQAQNASPSDAELLSQAVTQFEAGQLDQAQQTVDQIDPNELSADQQARLERLSDSLANLTAARQQLNSALAAERQGDLNKAMTLYRQLTADRTAPQAYREAALTGMARVESWMRNGAKEDVAPVNLRGAEAVATAEPAGADRTSAMTTTTPAPAEPAETAPVETAQAAPAPMPQPADQPEPTPAEQPTPAEPTGTEVAQAQPAEEPAEQPQDDETSRQYTQTYIEALQAEREGNVDRAERLYKSLAGDDQAPRNLRTAARMSLERLAELEKPAQPAATTVTVEPAPAEQPAETQPTGTAVAQAPPAEEPAEQPEPAPTEVVQEPEPSAQPAESDILEQARNLRIQQLMAKGEAAQQAGEFARAADFYRSILALEPQNQQAQQELARSQALAGQDSGEGVLGTYVLERELRAQQAVARYQQAMNRAEAEAEAGNYEAAQDAVVLARTVLDTNRQYLAEAEYARLREQALSQAETLAQAAEQARRQQIAEDQQRIAEEQAAEREKAEQAREQRVLDLLERTRELVREQKYREALELVDQVLFIDPNNVAGQFMQDMLKDQILLVRTRDLYRQRDYELMRQTNDILADTVPHSELILYPPDWPQLTEQRREYLQQSIGESEINRRTSERLQQPIPVDFNSNRFENVIEYLRNVTGVNFFVNWRALEGAGIQRDQPVSMQLSNVAAEKALRLILEEVGGELVNLGFAIDEGVVIISTDEQLAQRTAIRTYDIRDLIVQIPNFSDAPEFDLNAVASDTGDGGGGGGDIFGDDDTDDEDIDIPRAELILRIMDLIRNSVDPDNWRAAGGLTSSMEELNGTLIVNTTPENHGEIGALLSQLREQRALQISIDARFLFVTQNFLEEVGIDVDMALTHDQDWVSNPIIFGNNTANLALAEDTAMDGSLAPVVFPSAFLSTTGGNPLSFLIDDLQVDVLIRATQQDRRSITLNTPRLTFFNGQRAYLTVSRQTAFVSDLEPVGSGDAIAFDPEIDVVSDGVVLDVAGTISADRRYVTLTVRPSLAQLLSLEEFGTQAIIQGDDGDDDGDGGTEDQIIVGSIQQPVIQLTTVRTSVSVPDKGTLMLGGQRLMGEIEIEAGVPVLSKIPLLNRLFTNRSTVRDERTLLILIKPTIIVQSEHEEKLFPGLNQSPELFNLRPQPLP